MGILCTCEGNNMQFTKYAISSGRQAVIILQDEIPYKFTYG